MKTKTLYRYVRDDGGTTVSLTEPADREYTTLCRLIADEGKVLTNGTDKVSCIDTEKPEEWTEIEDDEELYDTVENTPENAPVLWEDIQYKDGYRIIPEVITAGLAFSMGEYGSWQDKLYKSLIDSNVWTPDAYPSGWEEVVE